MAHLLFGADLSLALSDHGCRSGPDANSGVPITGVGATDDTYAWPHCTQALGKKDHPAGLVDYLGASPPLETGVQAPIPSARNYKSCDTVNIPEIISTQLTMFYAGTMNVFDNVTEDKAQIVLSLAEKSNSMHANTSSFKMPMAPSIQPSAPYCPKLQDLRKRMQPDMQEKLTTAAHLSVGERLQISEDVHAQESASLLVPYQAIVPKALPIARKASLTRFLEKRKERVRLVAPYLAKGSARDIIHQGGAHHACASASALQKYYNEFWGGTEKLRCASPFAYSNTVDVEEHNWFASVENSKQASECESAT